jgi:hypothetical protein
VQSERSAMLAIITDCDDNNDRTVIPSASPGQTSIWDVTETVSSL